MIVSDLMNELDAEALREKVRSSRPFPHFCIDNFLKPEFAREVLQCFPDIATANQICMSLPNTVASQTSFCVWSGSAPRVADNEILIAVTSPTSVVITWNTSIPTTTTLLYSSDPLNPGATIQYINAGQGYTTAHEITISNINLVARHLFMVGGSVQGSSAQISSGEQWL